MIMKKSSALLVAVLLAAATLSSAAARELGAIVNKKSAKGPAPVGGNHGGPGFGSDPGGFFGPGGEGFGNIPGFGGTNGWGNLGGGYGGGYGGPGGGYSKGGIVQPTVVCSERGPCYKKKLTCPAKCFSSYSRSGKNYGGGGGGGGCTVDCKKQCVAYC